MKRFTFVIAIIFIAISSFGQNSAPRSMKAQDNGKFTIVENSSLSKDVLEDTDTLWNFDLATASITVYGFGETTWGYWTGHNQYGFTKCAEKFTAPASGSLNGFVYLPAVAYDAGSNTITFKVWGDNAGEPGTELASQAVNLADISTTGLNDLEFATPVSVDGTFYIGYELAYNTPVDTFAMAQTQISNNNTFLFESSGAWSDMPTGTGGSISGSNLAIGARVNIVLSDPLAELNTDEWAAGSIEVNTSSTSGTFTLTNTGVGTLTVSAATDLSSTPFSTTFNASEVSLDANESYDFTFDFEPTAVGTSSETFTLTTNGGNLDITLTGTATPEITGDMDGGFESNVNDFDLTFTGWTQHDGDGSGTYGFTGVSFTNSGYIGSFIAFNPSTTVAPMTADAIQPNNGDRFGACFSASTPPNNDWLITPQSGEITASGIFRMYVKTYTDEYGKERYTVNVSTTGTDVADFTKISSGTYVEADTLWTEVTYDLSAYQGEQVYVGIQCVSNDAFIFMVDDIDIVETVDNMIDEINEVSVYPNPANDVVIVKNAENATVTIINMVGQVVASQEMTSNRESVNISDLSEGTYIIRIENGAEVNTQKLNVIR